MDIPLCPKKENSSCLNCNSHFKKLRQNIRQVVVTRRFLKEAKDFDINTILNCENINFEHLHKFEENIGGNKIFRALKQGKHIVYTIDKQNRLIFLRAFDNFKEYTKFLEDKRDILKTIKRSE